MRTSKNARLRTVDDLKRQEALKCADEENLATFLGTIDREAGATGQAVQ